MKNRQYRSYLNKENPVNKINNDKLMNTPIIKVILMLIWIRKSKQIYPRQVENKLDSIRKIKCQSVYRMRWYNKHEKLDNKNGDKLK